MYTYKHLCVAPPCTWDRGITKILTFPSAKLEYIPCTTGAFKTSNPLSRSPPINTCLRLPLFWWTTQGLTYPNHCRHRQKPLYATAFTGLMGPWMQMKAALTQIRIEHIPKLVSRLNCFGYHSNRKNIIRCIYLFLFLPLFCNHRDQSFTVGGQTDRQTDRQTDGGMEG